MLQARRLHRLLFEPHPFLSVVPKPGVHARYGNTEITHNRAGFRGPELRPERDRERLVALGGSSTYCVTVSDDETWPHQLQRILGSEYEVVNLGVPGYTTVENTIQTAFGFSDLKPSIALYYVGWNDLRNTHVANLDPYYAEFHGRSQPGNLGLERTYPGILATVFYFGRLFDLMLDQSPPTIPTGAEFTADVDARALALYRRNLTNILALSKAQGVRPVLIPHLLNETALTAETSYGWIPYVRDKHLPRMMATYNRVLREVASENAEIALSVVQEGDFEPADFADQGHFSSGGSRKFASLVATAIIDAGLVRPRGAETPH